MHVPGSKATYTEAEIPDLFVVPDWFPEDHSKMPDVVAHGRKPGVMACAHCHLANGLGRPENSSVAGLPKGYMMAQMEAFRSGDRKSSEPRLASTAHMVELSKAATPEEMKAGVEYFASLKPAPWIRVVEAAEIPKTQVVKLMLIPAKGGGMEPIGDRVVEMPEDLEQTELRNPRSGFVAYVPPGSLKRGEVLVKTGGEGKTMACTMCHSQDLRGMGEVPSIAGRSPSQMARQMIDFQTGARGGPAAGLMKGVTTKLTESDMVAITGYLASLKP
jgi:cytochrome c553